MAIADLIKVRQVAEVALSPDGTSIAYSLTQMRNVLAGEKNGPAWRHLYVAAGPGQAKPFVIGETSVSDIAFTPDGTAITFCAKQSGVSYTSIYRIPTDGGGAQLFYAHDAAIQDYAWAPDGKALYFIASGYGDLTRSKLAKKGFNARVYEEDARPNALWRLEISGKSKTAIEIAVDGHASQIALTPNGRYLAVVTAPTTLVDDRLMRRRLHFVRPSNGKVRHTVETPGKIGAFAVAPNSKDFVILAGVDQHDPAATTLYKGRIGKKELVPIRSGAFSVMDVDWLDDGRIAALVHEGEASRIELLDEAGTVLQSINQRGRIAHALAAENGRIAAISSAPEHPREVFVLAGDRLEQWTDHNAWTQDIQFASASSFSYAARDGERISGVLTQPLKRRKNKRVPLILMVHGGPESHDSNGWNTGYSRPAQIAASLGYASFMPNYRGSTGRGTAFSKAHQNDYAGKEFNDLLDGVRALVADGLVDDTRVGITGGSYGGYAAAWAATALSQHFAASVMFVGISNQISKFGTTDIPNEMYLVHSRIWPWENWDKMLRASPITYAGQSRTPTLILHGEEDTRVHPSQSYELYRHLKLRSAAPVRFITYPGEGHGNRKAAAQLDYALRLMRWMDHFVQQKRQDLPPQDLDTLEAMMN
ncbi:MAG: S9 family peptidase [Pseudomonadota bacterium]